MEILVEYDNGNRFAASCDGHVVTTGKGDDGESARDGMYPAQLFVAALGMCIGGYVASYCKHHDVPCEGMRIEMSRETARAPSRTTGVHAKIRLPVRPSAKDQKAILRVADQCHITNSIKLGVHVVCSLTDTGDVPPTASTLEEEGTQHREQ